MRVIRVPQGRRGLRESLKVFDALPAVAGRQGVSIHWEPQAHPGICGYIDISRLLAAQIRLRVEFEDVAIVGRGKICGRPHFKCAQGPACRRRLFTSRMLSPTADRTQDYASRKKRLP